MSQWESAPVTVCCKNGHEKSRLVKFSVFTEDRVPIFHYYTQPLEQPRLRFTNWNGKQIHEASERIFERQIRCGVCREARWFADADLADWYDDTPHDKSVDLLSLASIIGRRRT